MLKALAKRIPLVGQLRTAWKADIEFSSDQIRKDINRLTRLVEELSAGQQAAVDRSIKADRTAMQVKSAFRLNDQQRHLIAACDTRLNPATVIAHVRQAVMRAELLTDPFPHVVVDKLLPDDVYKLALDAIPPELFFGERDPIKQNLRLPMDFGPTLSARVWDFIEETVARDAIRPAVLEKFHEHLQTQYELLFGASLRDRAQALPQSISGGRLMLRRAGYHLSAHRDPKRTMLTCLMYFARTKDSETYGTQVFRVRDDREASYTQTYYPEEAGQACELVKLVPYRPNTALIFLNSSGAHGADIPADAPRKLERYSYQFYIGPDLDALNELIALLPADRQAKWRSKKEVV